VTQASSQAEPVEIVHPKLLVQPAFRGAHLEGRRLGRRHHEAEPGDLREIGGDGGRGRNQYFARPQHAQLVGQRL